MKTNVIHVGNARGIRIPKALLEQCRLQDEVEIEVQGNPLVIRRIAKPRSGWEDAFRRMHELGDDRFSRDSLNRNRYPCIFGN